LQITSRQSEVAELKGKSRQDWTDKITAGATNRMMHSAIFGQLIIIIVFIPILSLSGIEGKMFKPMALTFCFALLGAMFLCFTYVPVLSSVFIKPGSNDEKSWNRKLMNKIKGWYEPLLFWALDHTRIVIITAIGLFTTSIVIMTNLGGEFIPTLDEGDFVIQPILETGTSLGKTIEITTEIEKVVRSFPEVKQVITRIGAAEVPTDPMSMEETDVIIILKPKNQWISSTSGWARAIVRAAITCCWVALREAWAGS